MTNCPSCGTSGAYVGFTSVSCTKPDCKFYEAPEIKNTGFPALDKHVFNSSHVAAYKKYTESVKLLKKDVEKTGFTITFAIQKCKEFNEVCQKVVIENPDKFKNLSYRFIPDADFIVDAEL